MSDNGPQMRAGTTREFWALCSIAARVGRPGTPTDQAWIETLFGHVKGEWPYLEQITDPNTLRTELDLARHDYNHRRLHASLGYVTPDDEHQGRGDTIRQARRDGLTRARLNRIESHWVCWRLGLLVSNQCVVGLSASVGLFELCGGVSPRWLWRRWVLCQCTQPKVASSTSSTLRHGPPVGPRMSSVL